MYSTPYSCQSLLKLELPRQIFEKYSDIKFHEKSVQQYPNCSLRTDRRLDMTKLIVVFSQLCERTKNC